MKLSAVLLSISALGLFGCGGVQNMHTVKSNDYGTAPKNIVAVLADADPSFPAFKARLTEKMASCGIKLQFATLQPGQTHINAPSAEALLLFRELGRETTKTSSYGRQTDMFVSMYRYEITLTDIAEKKIVWKGLGDFRTKENSKNIITRSLSESPAAAWSADLMNQMKKDGLIGSCDASQIDTATYAPPAPQTSPGQSIAALPKPVTYKVGDATYDSLEAAEAAMRIDAAKEIDQIIPFGGAGQASLLMVVPTVKQQKTNIVSSQNQNAMQQEQVLAYIAVISSVNFDTTADAIRKSSLFKQVTLIRADDVAESDFRGADYKLWRASNSWLLAKQGGGQQKVSSPPMADIKLAGLTVMLNSLQGAIASLDSH